MSHPSRALRLVALVCLGLLTAASARPDVLVHADGRRSEGKEPRKDGQGRWTVEREGRRVVLQPGDVVALVDADGNETDLIPVLVEAPLDAVSEGHLAALRDPKAGEWRNAAEALAASPTRGTLDALAQLADHKDAALRGRGLAALMRLRTRESVVAAVRRVLAEKDRSVRRAAASELFSVEELYRRCDLAEETLAGLKDKDAELRIVFALLAPRDLEAAVPVLQRDGLASADHHVRESAALELGLRGDGAGERVLTAMLARKALDVSDDVALNTRLLVQEQVEVCAALGRIATKGAHTALDKALRSPHEAVRSAAQAALAAMGGG